ncbi:TRAP transporter permease [Deinococcus peraridilitoris]|uniref:TRAP transporter, 4TM/12TM fusion protein n=1 Tax=Deinococcus peraridilitoris (strain DSM 19664 / LMG 22246 / CIP 109416 / KR-200) TaxID=937777 RepID=L0A467_DEIPD|nr:TRAP transporter fused permease subunit [Deinococcus peraridilitoris]AFZ68673.1 TRAP transporter, 4TM/12TM fusion protein [Deinococcus peraridilitoris DSM 19664]
MDHLTEVHDDTRPVAPWLRHLTYAVLLIAALYHLYLVAHPFMPWSASGIAVLELTQVQRATHVFFIVLAGYLLSAQAHGRKFTSGAGVFAVLMIPFLYEFLRLDLPLPAKILGSLAWLAITLPAVVPKLQRYLDLLVAVFAIAPYVYLITQYETLIYRAVLPEPWDLAMGFGLTAAVLGLAFRMLGPVLPSLVLVFTLYNVHGSSLPGAFSTAGMPLDMLVGKLYSETEAGLFGIITGVSLKYLVYFTILGSVITALGFGPIIARLALRAVGRSPMAPGRAVGLMSVFMGFFSGSGAADTQFVATVTKPMMEKSGYDRLTAAGLTATAGSIALITPPVLGSIAFVMVEVLNIDYLSITIMALGPCILYLAGVWFYNEFHVRRQGMKGDVMGHQGKVARYTYVFLPLVLIMGMLYLGYNVSLSVTIATLAFIALAFLDPTLRPPLRRVFDGLASGFAHLVPIGAAVVCANIIMTLMVLTGLPSKVSQFLTLVSNENLLIATLLAAGFSLILGMGVPPIATYVLTSALLAPALVALAVNNGIPEVAALLSTHMFLFYYAVLADVTPPVALSAFAASSVYGTDPIKTGVATARVALPKYFLGMFFILAYPATAILIVPVVAHQGLAAALPLIIYRFAASILGVLFMSAATAGYARRELQRWESWLLGIAGVALLSPYWTLNALAFVVGAYFFLFGRGRQTAPAA